MNVPAILFAGAAAINVVIAVWMGIEAYLLFSGQQPITWYVRNQVSWHFALPWLISIFVVAAIVMGVTHFVLDAPDA